MSHPVWVRGLKHIFLVLVVVQFLSHPVWVRGLKLWLKSPRMRLVVSHPVWVRGLKQNKVMKHTILRKSHPVWVRGLKHNCTCSRLHRGRVAPRVGAWIETSIVVFIVMNKSGRTPCGCVD